MVSPVVKLDGSSRFTHTVTTPYLLSRFGFQETPPIADECDGRRLTVASCSTSHSCTIKDKVTALARPDDSTGILRFGHTSAAVSPNTCISLRLVPMQRILPSPLQHRQETDRVRPSDHCCPDGAVWSKRPTTLRLSESQR